MAAREAVPLGTATPTLEDPSRTGRRRRTTRFEDDARRVRGEDRGAGAQPAARRAGSRSAPAGGQRASRRRARRRGTARGRARRRRRGHGPLEVEHQPVLQGRGSGTVGWAHGRHNRHCRRGSRDRVRAGACGAPASGGRRAAGAVASPAPVPGDRRPPVPRPEDACHRPTAAPLRAAAPARCALGVLVSGAATYVFLVVVARGLGPAGLRALRRRLVGLARGRGRPVRAPGAGDRPARGRRPRRRRGPWPTTSASSGPSAAVLAVAGGPAPRAGRRHGRRRARPRVGHLVGPARRHGVVRGAAAGARGAVGLRPARSLRRRRGGGGRGADGAGRGARPARRGRPRGLPARWSPWGRPSPSRSPCPGARRRGAGARAGGARSAPSSRGPGARSACSSSAPSSSQLLLNAGPVVLDALSAPGNREPSRLLAGLSLARVPLFLFTAVQAALHPAPGPADRGGRPAGLRRTPVRPAGRVRCSPRSPPPAACSSGGPAVAGCSSARGSRLPGRGPRAAVAGRGRLPCRAVRGGVAGRAGRPRGGAARVGRRPGRPRRGDRRRAGPAAAGRDGVPGGGRRRGRRAGRGPRPGHETAGPEGDMNDTAVTTGVLAAALWAALTGLGLAALAPTRREVRDAVGAGGSPGGGGPARGRPPRHELGSCPSAPGSGCWSRCWPGCCCSPGAAGTGSSPAAGPSLVTAAAAACGVLPVALALHPAVVADEPLVHPAPNNDSYYYVSVADWLVDEPGTRVPDLDGGPEVDGDSIAAAPARSIITQHLRLGESLVQATASLRHGGWTPSRSGTRHGPVARAAAGRRGGPARPAAARAARPGCSPGCSLRSSPARALPGAQPELRLHPRSGRGAAGPRAHGGPAARPGRGAALAGRPGLGGLGRHVHGVPRARGARRARHRRPPAAPVPSARAGRGRAGGGGRPCSWRRSWGGTRRCRCCSSAASRPTPDSPRRTCGSTEHGARRPDHHGQHAEGGRARRGRRGRRGRPPGGGRGGAAVCGPARGLHGGLVGGACSGTSRTRSAARPARTTCGGWSPSPCRWSSSVRPSAGPLLAARARAGPGPGRGRSRRRAALLGGGRGRRGAPAGRPPPGPVEASLGRGAGRRTTSCQAPAGWTGSAARTGPTCWSPDFLRPAVARRRAARGAGRVLRLARHQLLPARLLGGGPTATCSSTARSGSAGRRRSVGRTSASSCWTAAAAWSPPPPSRTRPYAWQGAAGGHLVTTPASCSCGARGRAEPGHGGGAVDLRRGRTRHRRRPRRSGRRDPGPAADRGRPGEVRAAPTTPVGSPCRRAAPDGVLLGNARGGAGHQRRGPPRALRPCPGGHRCG